MRKIEIFDSTLRDGAQGGNVNFSAEDKFHILRELDAFGVDYIEAGNPSSNQKDMEFFQRAASFPLRRAKLVAFGSTRRKNLLPQEDRNVQALGEAGTEYVAVFGKSWDMHALEILHTTLEENLAMIADTIRYFTGLGKTVFFDAEHFFDGYRANPGYALQTLRAAEEAGASRLVLCDTNGGCFPEEIAEITRAASEAVQVPLGIHCHNDTGCAVANSLAAVKAGAVQVQGTFTGMGERCGNACLSAVIGNLQLKKGIPCVPEESLPLLTKTAVTLSEIANLALPDNLPYVGKNAFAHKGGMHVDGVAKNPASFEHIPPESVGNQRQFLLSEVAGRTVILSKLRTVAPGLTRESPETRALIDMLKEREYEGYQYEAAEASFEILVKSYLGLLPRYFDIAFFKVIGEMQEGRQNPSSAMVKVLAGEQTELTAGEGEGPVNALDLAMKQALRVFYPVLDQTRLTDYKVRVMDGKAGTAAVVRVLITSTDGQESWTTVGASSDIINASVIALTDSINYKLMRAGVQGISS